MGKPEELNVIIQPHGKMPLGPVRFGTKQRNALHAMLPDERSVVFSALPQSVIIHFAVEPRDGAQWQIGMERQARCLQNQPHR